MIVVCIVRKSANTWFVQTTVNIVEHDDIATISCFFDRSSTFPFFLSFFLFFFFFFLSPPEFGGLLREQLSEKFRGNVAKSRKRRNSRDYRFSVLKSVLLCLETVLLAFNGETRVKRGTFLFLSFAFAYRNKLRLFPKKFRRNGSLRCNYV